MAEIEYKNTAIVTLHKKLSELDHEDELLDKEYATKKRKIKEEKNQVKAAIQLLKDNDNSKEVIIKGKRGRKPIPLDNTDYPFTSGIRNKMLFAIKDMGRFVHVREIADYIVNKEPGTTKEYVMDYLGKYFYKYRNEGYVSSYQVGISKRNVFWGLPNWLDSNNQIKEGFEFNKEELRDRLADFIAIPSASLMNITNEKT